LATSSSASIHPTNEKQIAPSGLSARGRDKKAQLSALPEYRHEFDQMQCSLLTFSAPFTRPEIKVRRASYPVIKPSASRGILDVILMKPIEEAPADAVRQPA
jgi:CRISPR-associated Cas5-like protein